MRRRSPVVILAVGALILLVSYVWYTQRIRTELALETQATSQLYALVYRAQSDTTAGAADAALIEMTNVIRERGVPLVLTARDGSVTDTANLPPESSLNAAQIAAYRLWLDERNAPITLPDGKQVHFGNTAFVEQMRFVPTIQAVALLVLLVAGVAVLRTHDRAERERVWAGMARESAHQLGTPLSSLHGWVELLRSRSVDASLADALPHIDGDLERLERVAHRFERIGREPRVEALDALAVVNDVAGYFRPRLPTLAQAVQLDVVRGDGTITVHGDRVLLEWALESLVKNAIDALAGQGGRIEIRIDPMIEGGARIRVSDDGPGVPREIRRRIFAAGFTTKAGGWGIGLALTRRIVESGHGGRLTLLNTDRGAAFEIILPG